MEIKYPKKRQNEAEMQALLWYFLRKRKIDARLQVITPITRLDIVVFKSEKPICIIECKSWSRSYSIVRQYRLNNTKQLQKYKGLFGLPVLICGRANDIDKVLSQVSGLCNGA